MSTPSPSTTTSTSPTSPATEFTKTEAIWLMALVRGRVHEIQIHNPYPVRDVLDMYLSVQTKLQAVLDKT